MTRNMFFFFFYLHWKCFLTFRYITLTHFSAFVNTLIVWFVVKKYDLITCPQMHSIIRLSHICCSPFNQSFPGSSDGECACNTRVLSLILGSGRSPGEGNGYLLQYSYLDNSMDINI